MLGEPDGETIYTYREVDSKVLESTRWAVVTVETADLWGWCCTPCGEDSGAVLNRTAAQKGLEEHCRSRQHRDVFVGK